jgi:threonine-phosphate decarboxylase
MPAAAADAICSHLEAYEAYPDISCGALRDALSRAEGVSAGNIVCTAGASDLIARVCATVQPEVALVTAPCFSGYEQALENVGATIVRHELRHEDGFNVTERILDEEVLTVGKAPSCSLVFLCNPNNPTGLTLSSDLIERIVAAAAEVGAIVVLDECFIEFTDEPSAVRLVDTYPNLLVMRAFTKLYAMAGLRLGYGICSDAQLLQALESAGQLWAVSGPAQYAGIAALGVGGWAERTRAYVDHERALLKTGLESCGMRVIPGKANYLLFQSDRELYEPLLDRGFLIRRCGNFVGLDDSWYRIAVRTAQENAAFLAALKEVCR